MIFTYQQAMADPSLPVGQMLPVQSVTIPAKLRSRWVESQATGSWSELVCPMDDEHLACRFGCKVYVRRQGATLRFGVLHSLSYGHSHSPDVRGYRIPQHGEAGHIGNPGTCEGCHYEEFGWGDVDRARDLDMALYGA